MDNFDKEISRLIGQKTPDDPVSIEMFSMVILRSIQKFQQGFTSSANVKPAVEDFLTFIGAYERIYWRLKALDALPEKLTSAELEHMMDIGGVSKVDRYFMTPFNPDKSFGGKS